MSETLVEMAKRLCAGAHCKHEVCPIWKERFDDNGTLHGCIVLGLADNPLASRQFQALQDWAAANPPKTYKDVLLERFPEAALDEDGKPEACRKHLFKADCYWTNPVRTDCQRCWDRPYKEDGNAAL